MDESVEAVNEGGSAYIGQMLSAIHLWTIDLEDYPGWTEWNHQKVQKTLSLDDLPVDSVSETSDHFLFSEELELQHAVVFQFLALHRTLKSLTDCEYYFRRYPFHGLPVSHFDHLTNICEMYFSRFYEFRERLKNYLNALAATVPDKKLDIGKFIKKFDKTFNPELRTRNLVHHHQRFEDLAIDRIFLAHTLSVHKSDEAWLAERNAMYRAFTREWVDRVRRRSRVMNEYLEATACATLKFCDFLQVKTHPEVDV